MSKATIGIVGTGFIARGAAHEIIRATDLRLGAVLTRRPPSTVEGLPRDNCVHSVEELVAGADLILECSGDVVHATPVLEDVLSRGLPVVTMDSELHVTTGSWLTRRGYLTEAEGDQPGCLARLHRESLEQGFEPLAYVNLKGYLNPKPVYAEMEMWSERQSIRLPQVVSFTDGSKVEIEKALVANGLKAVIPPHSIGGAAIEDLADTDYLVEIAHREGRPVSDYVLARGAPPGVVVLAEHEQARMIPEYRPLSRLLTTRGSAYQLLRPHHLCHLEVVRTLRAVLAGEPPLLDNTRSPRYGAFAVTKRRLEAGETLEGLGGFEVRARVEAFEEADREELIPACLAAGARVIRSIEADQWLSFQDVELKPSRALEVVLAMRSERLAGLSGDQEAPRLRSEAP